MMDFSKSIGFSALYPFGWYRLPQFLVTCKKLKSLREADGLGSGRSVCKPLLIRNFFKTLLF